MAAEEHVPEPTNPLGIDGLEFIEYATSQPEAFGALLQRMGFAAVARHRSREVMLYRQGSMNLIVNSAQARGGEVAPTPVLAAVALRVRDAGRAFERSLELGAWEMPTRAAAMELHIPGIHGVGDSLLSKPRIESVTALSALAAEYVALGARFGNLTLVVLSILEEWRVAPLWGDQCDCLRDAKMPPDERGRWITELCARSVDDAATLAELSRRSIGHGVVIAGDLNATPDGAAVVKTAVDARVAAIFRGESPIMPEGTTVVEVGDEFVGGLVLRRQVHTHEVLGVGLRHLDRTLRRAVRRVADETELTEEYLSDPKNIRHGQELWRQQCVKCHGAGSYPGKAPKLNPSRSLITGVICGVRVEQIEDETMREIRYLDKLIDELARGKKMEKILRSE